MEASPLDSPHSLEPHTQPPSFSLLSQARLEKRVLLCVSGSIAAYKALELASSLRKLGAEVAVVMSAGAEQFVTPLSFEAISHHRVLRAGGEDWSAGAGVEQGERGGVGGGDVRSVEGEDMGGDFDSFTLVSPSTSSPRPSVATLSACNHIAYARWADLAIIAPASANTIAKLAHGIADSPITQTLLATRAPLLLAPAMNTAMLHAPQTRENLAYLRRLGVEVIAPRAGRLACDSVGEGALATVEELLFALLRAGRLQDETKRGGFWRGRTVCITGGGSSAFIDPVRAISNHSSGLQASALALALYTLGARVSLISSSFPVPLPSAIHRIYAHSNEEYQAAILHATRAQDMGESQGDKETERERGQEGTCGQEGKSPREKPIVFMVAALADFAPESRAQKKLKKSQLPKLELTLTPALDVLAELDSREFIKIGFKAEDNFASGLERARALLLPREKGGKDCSIVCLNTLDSKPFGAEENCFTLLDSRALENPNSYTTTPRAGKLALSYAIADFVAQALDS